MSIQDKLERTLKEIHIILAEGEENPAKPETVIVNKKDVIAVLEKLNLIVYEMMDQYEVTSQSRELAQRRNEKKGEELIARIERQAEDVYAASLIYTDDAMNRVHHLIADALSSSKKMFKELHQEIEKEQHKVREHQLELREQLQDFKDTNKYLAILESCNKEREKELLEKEGLVYEKRIQNEARHYTMKEKPEIRINQAYFQRRGLMEESEGFTSDDADTSVDTPEIRVDLDAEYFKWQAGENAKDNNPERGKRKFLFGKLNRKDSE